MGATGWRRIGSVLLALVMAMALGGCFDWTQYGTGANSFHNPSESTLTPDSIDGLTALWADPTPSARVFTWGNRVVLTSTSGTKVVDAATGAEVWSDPTRTYGSVTDGVLFRGVFGHSCRYQPGQGPTPSSYGGIGAVSVADGTVRSDLSQTFPDNSMQGVWNIMSSNEHRATVYGYAGYGSECEGPYPSFSARFDGNVSGPGGGWLYQLALDDTTDTAFMVYTPDLNASVFEAIDMTNGSTRWHLDEHHYRLAVSGGFLLVDDHRILDAATGSELWTLDSAPQGEPHAMRYGTIYRGQSDGTVSAYTDCGNPSCPPAWTGTGDGASASVVVAGDLVYAATRGPTDSTLRVYPAGGCGQPSCDPMATFDLPGQATGLVVARGQVVASTTTGTYAYGVSG